MRREEVGSHLDVENEYKDKRRGREGGREGRGRKDREERGRGEGVRDNDKREMRSERRQ